MSRSKNDLSFLTLPQYETELMGELTIHGGNGVVASDWHLPIVSEASIRHLITTAKRMKATDWLAIPGDWFNFDALSDYMPKQDDHDLSTEILISRKLMRILLRTFDRIIVALGNHDVRIMRALGFKMKFEQSMALCFGELPFEFGDRLEFTGRDYILNDTSEGLWRFCHTNQYSKNQLIVPSQIADINQQHVAAGHRHHHSIGLSPSGLWVVELGGLFDHNRTAYLKRWSSSHPHWQNGYMVLRDGVPYLPMLQESRFAG